MTLHPLPALRTWSVRLAALLFGLVEWVALSRSRAREAMQSLRGHGH